MKNTKRSMIITTLLMVVVLVVAISTSTFAWYTAAGTGSATSAQISSATSDTANISVGWTKDAMTSTIQFYNPANALSPMCPSAELTDATNDPTFYTNDLAATGVFNDNKNTVNAWTVADAAEAQYTSFYVTNKNVNATASIKMTMTATKVGDVDITSLLRVAVYAKQGGAEATYACVGVLGGTYVYGDPANNTSPNALGNDGASVPNIVFDLAKSGSDGDCVQIKLFAWLDGTALTQQFAGQTVNFEFAFGLNS